MKRTILHEPSSMLGRRTGRHVWHDPASKRFPAPKSNAIVSVRHHRRVPIFDQGDLGSCTGNAAAGAMSTDPFTLSLTEKDAVSIYAEATHYDRVRGIYPPIDTGSSGLAVAKVLKKRGWIGAYSHAFGLDHVLRALSLRPGIMGITWLEGCDHPDRDGVVEWRGSARGGHEVCMVGIDVPGQLVWLANSWGTGWGLDGFFAMTWSDLDRALHADGDATFFH